MERSHVRKRPTYRVPFAPLFVAAFSLSLAFCAIPAGAVTLPSDFRDRLVSAVGKPTTIAFTPDQRLLIASQPGVLYVKGQGSAVASAALDLTAKACADSERGLLGIAVDPRFTVNHYIYLYYTFKKFGLCDRNSTTSPVNRVSRFTLSDTDIVDPGSEVVLLDNIPSPNGNHNGGDLQFGKDRFLYIGVGDGGCDYAENSGCGGSNDAARDQNVLLGKILRITSTGGIPPTNPFQGSDSARCNLAGRTDAGKKCQETYAWGLRNPFRLIFDRNSSATRFYINDVGESVWEEIDLGRLGADYGWNVREGPCATGSTTNCSAPPAGMTNPIYSYTHSSGCSAITGGAFPPTGVWPSAFDGSYLYADYVCGKIFKLTPSGGGFTQTEFASGLGVAGITSVIFGPYGSSKALYYITYANGGEVHRISYEGYPTPRSAASINASLVPAFEQCLPGSTNGRHAPPFPAASCPPVSTAPPTLGAQSRASAQLGVLPGDPATSADEADVTFAASITDVRAGSQTGVDFNPLAGADLLLGFQFRMTDRGNCTPSPCSGSFDTAGTTQPLRFSIPVSCATTLDATVGATCSASTTADALAPFTISEGRRTMLQAFRLRVEDGGLDGVLGSQDDRLFAQQGAYVP